MEKPPPVNDAELLAQVANQERVALSTLYDRYSRIIYGLAYKSLGSIEESEEVVLDVFAQIWRIAHRFERAKGRPDTWIFTLARSRILDRLRKLQRSRAATNISIEATEIQPRAANVDLWEDITLLERRQRILAVLAKIPEEQRRVLELAYYQGFSAAQIADHLGLPLGTVKTRIRLGLSKLKTALDGERDS
jgi:RNA polymerase sigma-70 factor, ECF subfamily